MFLFINELILPFKSWYLSVQGPFSGIRLELFLQDVNKNKYPPDHAWYWTFWKFSAMWRDLA